MKFKAAVYKFTLVTFVATLVSGLLFTGVAQAFNQGNVIDDRIFDNSGAMNASQIDSFLNGRASSCISTNSGFAAKLPTGYTPSGGFTYGGFVSAGQVIATSAQVYGINPQVLLTTLQKEQSLVSASSSYCNDSNEHKYAAAVGYGCPDGGTVYNWTGVSLYRRNGVEHTSTGNTCVNSAAKAGFSQQVIRAAWLLKFGQQRSKGNVNWAVVSGSWDNSDDPQSCYGGPMTQGTFQRCPGTSATYYDGYYTIDGTSVHIDNGATAALYWYTPHFHGNQNFYDIFTGWFGSTQSTGVILNNSLAANQLSPGTTMRGGDYIVSPNGKFVTTMQYDGNFVTYAGSKAVWNTGTSTAYGNYAVFQNDGNLVVYNSSGSPLWWSGTWGVSADSAKLGDDGNLRVYAGSAQKFTSDNRVNSYATRGIGNQISSGTRMNTGDFLQSPDGRYSLVMQSNGNLVLYSADNAPIWSSGTGGQPGSYAIVQNDGNLVVYNAGNVPLWWSGTWGNNASTLKLQNDGNLVLYRNSDNAFTWATWSQFNNYQVNTYIGTQIASGTTLRAGEYLRSPDWRYTAVMQEDGNLVVYFVDRYAPIWNSRTWNNGGAYAVLQNDGNLVVYDKNGQALWNTYTYTQGASVLKMQNDGNLVVYRNSDNWFTWNSFGY